MKLFNHVHQLFVQNKSEIADRAFTKWEKEYPDAAKALKKVLKDTEASMKDSTDSLNTNIDKPVSHEGIISNIIDKIFDKILQGETHRVINHLEKDKPDIAKAIKAIDDENKRIAHMLHMEKNKDNINDLYLKMMDN